MHFCRTSLSLSDRLDIAWRALSFAQFNALIPGYLVLDHLLHLQAGHRLHRYLDDVRVYRDLCHRKPLVHPQLYSLVLELQVAETLWEVAGDMPYQGGVGLEHRALF